ncbi:MAG TPA: DNA-processing protein DprA, partial [Acidimicrobiales bacterium]|nr:DNA-processing protein DprA [Acidimicrobiales bacterium]
GDDALPDAAYAAALLALPALWPARAAALMGISRRAARSARPGGGACGPAAHAWAMVRAGRAAEVPALRALIHDADADAVAAQWGAAARRVNVGAMWAAYRRLGVHVDVVGGQGYPPRLAAAGHSPYVLFRRGRHLGLDGTTAAIVGTRRATPAGREFAHELGAGLTRAGVRVVSGLALGIDAAAHEGALAARAQGAPSVPRPAGEQAADGDAAVAGTPIGVVAGGLDRPYPARHRVLWDRVAAAGALVSEWPLGTASEGWRFPARNRLIVALADVVVVVESRETGGSMVTAELAMERGVPVLAVPGSVRSAASAGTNRLLGEGAAPACSVADILTALSLDAGRSSFVEHRPPPTGDAATVLAALGWGPVATDALVTRTGLDPARLAIVLAHLELDGWVASGAGWWQRLAPASGE